MRLITAGLSGIRLLGVIFLGLCVSLVETDALGDCGMGCTSNCFLYQNWIQLDSGGNEVSYLMYATNICGVGFCTDAETKAGSVPALYANVAYEEYDRGLADCGDGKGVWTTGAVYRDINDASSSNEKTACNPS